jgi:hypothetical protein
VRPALVGLALLLAAAAPAPAQPREPEKRPGWVQALETANPYVSGVSDAYGGASAALDASKALRASQVSREVGNRAARKAAADACNAARASGQGAVKAIERFNVGTLTTVADVGGTLAGHLAEGDLRAVPGVAVNAAAKNVTASGGAWAGGAAGAALGSLAGPVGTLVGGAVGAAAGALGASLGYDATNDALARNGYHNVQSYVDSLAAEGPVDYVDKARQARREHLEAREDERRRTEKRRSEDLGSYVEQAREARRAHLEERERRDAEAQDWRERQDRRADAGPDRPPPAARSDQGIPVIPVDCTIDVVLWSEANPSARQNASLRVNGDTVTMHAESTGPGSQREGGRTSPTRTVDDFTGTRRDNVVSGTNHARSGPTRSENWSTATDGKGGSVRRYCVIEWTSNSTIEEEWTFLLGGQGRFRFSANGTTTRHYSTGCDYKPGGSETDSFSATDEGKVLFTWRIR